MKVFTAVFCLLFCSELSAATFAERLGWPAGTRAVILHVDDAGMSRQSNVGTLNAVVDGAANSMSVMMTCSWVSDLVAQLEKHPGLDVGLHLTLTSEWHGYRWGPLAGKRAVPGLVDQEGALWPTVAEVVQHASADEVETEIRAQIERAREIGIQPTHLDSHMGTLFAHDAFLERYIKVGIEEQIPVMFPGGHATALGRQLTADVGSEQAQATLARTRPLAEQIWAAGLPVLDDLHNTSYGWTADEHAEWSDEKLAAYKAELYAEALRELAPGVTMIILHSTDSDDHFDHISDSGPTRRGDMLAMLHPLVSRTLEEENIVLTTFRELKARRDAVEDP